MKVKKRTGLSMSRKPYTSRRKRRAYALVFTLILMLLPIAVFIEIKAPAVIYAMAEDRAKTIAVQAINNAVGDVFNDESDLCQNLVTLNFDEEGNIISADTNTALTNAVEGLILDGVVSRIDSASRYPIKIPLGTLTCLPEEVLPLPST